MRGRIRILSLCGVWACAPCLAQVPPAATPPATAKLAEPFTGTLFYSDAERAKLDAARRRSTAATRPTTPVDDRYQIQGWIRRGDGDTSVWVDGLLVTPVLPAVASKVNTNSVASPASDAISIRQQVTVRSEAPKAASPAKRPQKRKSSRAP